MATIVHERDQIDEDSERPSKRTKLDEPDSSVAAHLSFGADLLKEPFVGISEYVGNDVPKIHAIIKQRFTDFLVHEVDQDGIALDPTTVPPTEEPPKEIEEDPVWTSECDTRLAVFLPEDSIVKVKELFLQGATPPEGPSGEDAEAEELESAPKDSRGRGRGRGGRDRGRGGRGGRGRRGRVIDTRKVVSPPIAEKEVRTEFHNVIRELFRGKLETETDASTTSNTDEGSRIAIRWMTRGGRSNRGAARGPTPAQYIHFSMQKTNRDTQDALSHLSRMLHTDLKDLSVGGTKDKRGVTVQRVSLRRKNKTLEDVWRAVNGLNGRRSKTDAMTQRGERGVRIADISYDKNSLELGMLRGNAFVITLRNVEVESTDTIDRALSILKAKGFINYYGMQRFGLASVPTHTIGLALLKSNWEKDYRAHHGYLEKPVAERCILEFYKRNPEHRRDAHGALKTVPKTLRLMYVHAYQSYVWNSIVSERVRVGGLDGPVVGDLVVDGEDSLDEDELEAPKPSGSGKNQSRKPWSPPKIKTLSAEDLNKYTIFDVIMPLPGTDVSYPGGTLGDKYREYLRLDGLDPDNWLRSQKDYTLKGSYRKIMHLPKNISWRVLRYTDPDCQLAQSDEDKILGIEPPPPDADGKFMALQVEFILGTAAYATMALREITKTDTSTQHQIALTALAPDQKERKTQDV
ncbi:pseudouridine synthase [Flagelloscypha sp. PMI_526]|nr:pseudouridine synthase [Flagelloscypha sp. PMI_526]